MNKAIVSLLLVLMFAGSAHALTFVQMPDKALLDQASLVVEGEIVGVLPLVGQPQDHTVYQVNVTRFLKGSASVPVLVWVPGGIGTQDSGSQAVSNGVLGSDDGGAASDPSRVVPGMPQFNTGEAVLMFLLPRADGTYAILQSALGVFTKSASTSGRASARRQLAGTYELPGNGLGVLLPASDQVRDWEGFAHWLQATAAGAELSPTYWNATTPETESERANFTTLGAPSRWFEFDSNQTVTQLAGSSGQAGITGGGYAEFQTGITAWNNDAGSNILYSYGGLTGASGGLGTSDGVNAILFNDPNGDIPGSFNCVTGGVLASASYRVNGVGSFKGAVFRRIVESDIVIQDGAGCFLNGVNRTNAQEVFAHELGHTLGLGHSCGDQEIVPGVSDCTLNPSADDALMRAFVHADGRGASLRADDRAGAAFLYDAAASGSGGSSPPADGSGGESSRGGGGGGATDPALLLLLMLASALVMRIKVRPWTGDWAIIKE